jgi:hypothetical protein
MFNSRFTCGVFMSATALVFGGINFEFRKRVRFVLHNIIDIAEQHRWSAVVDVGQLQLFLMTSVVAPVVVVGVSLALLACAQHVALCTVYRVWGALDVARALVELYSTQRALLPVKAAFDDFIELENELSRAGNNGRVSSAAEAKMLVLQAVVAELQVLIRVSPLFSTAMVGADIGFLFPFTASLLAVSLPGVSALCVSAHSLAMLYQVRHGLPGVRSRARHAAEPTVVRIAPKVSRIAPSATTASLKQTPGCAECQRQQSR